MRIPDSTMIKNSLRLDSDCRILPSFPLARFLVRNRSGFFLRYASAHDIRNTQTPRDLWGRYVTH